MIEDEVIREVHRNRDELAREFDYDINRLFDYLKKKQAESGRKYVSFAKTEGSVDRRIAKTRKVDESV